MIYLKGKNFREKKFSWKIFSRNLFSRFCPLIHEKNSAKFKKTIDFTTEKVTFNVKLTK